MPLYTRRYLPTDLIQTTLIANPINNTSFHNYIIYIYIRIFTVTMVFKTFIITCKTRELLQYIIIYCCVRIVTHKCYIALAQSLDNATAYFNVILIFNTINTHMDPTNEHTRAVYAIIILLLCTTVGNSWRNSYIILTAKSFPKG